MQAGVFYDLGSGTGKVVLAAALLGLFARAEGIEILSELHVAAGALRDKYQQYIKSASPTSSTDMRCVLGDLTTIDWYDPAAIASPSQTALRQRFYTARTCYRYPPRFRYNDADVIYCNALAFTQELVESLVELVGRARSGTFLIVTGGHKLAQAPGFEKHFELKESQRIAFSWGESVCGVYRRL